MAVLSTNLLNLLTKSFKVYTACKAISWEYCSVAVKEEDWGLRQHSSRHWSVTSQNPFCFEAAHSSTNSIKRSVLAQNRLTILNASILLCKGLTRSASLITKVLSKNRKISQKSNLQRISNSKIPSLESMPDWFSMVVLANKRNRCSTTLNNDYQLISNLHNLWYCMKEGLTGKKILKFQERSKLLGPKRQMEQKFGSSFLCLGAP